MEHCIILLNWDVTVTLADVMHALRAHPIVLGSCPVMRISPSVFGMNAVRMREISMMDDISTTQTY